MYRNVLSVAEGLQTIYLVSSLFRSWSLCASQRKVPSVGGTSYSGNAHACKGDSRRKHHTTLQSDKSPSLLRLSSQDQSCMDC